MVKQFDVGKGVEKNYIEYHILPPPALFQEFRRYHLDGILKLEGKRFHSGLLYGQWTKYDKAGVVVEIIDHESGYGFSFEELMEMVAAYHKVQGIPEVDLLHRNTSIARQKTDEGKFWYFSWQAVPGRIDVLKIDGDSGEIVETSNYELKDD